MRKILATLALAVALAFGGVDTAEAQVIGGGLVVVNISQIDVETGNILSDINLNLGVGAALAIAANICDVAVNVLTVDLRRTGETTCESATGDQRVTITQRNQGRR